MAYYGTLVDAEVYHDALGHTEWTSHSSDTDKLAALTRGSQYIDGRYQYRYSTGRWASMFPGSKTGGRAQVLQWPRTDAVDYAGNEIGSAEIPIEVEQATYEAALIELVTPGALSPVYVGTSQVVREKIDVIEVQYAEPTTTDGQTVNRPVYPLIDEIIAPVLMGKNAGYFVAAAVYPPVAGYSY